MLSDCSLSNSHIKSKPYYFQSNVGERIGKTQISPLLVSHPRCWSSSTTSSHPLLVLPAYTAHGNHHHACGWRSRESLCWSAGFLASLRLLGWLHIQVSGKEPAPVSACLLRRVWMSSASPVILPFPLSFSVHVSWNSSSMEIVTSKSIFS